MIRPSLQKGQGKRNELEKWLLRFAPQSLYAKAEKAAIDGLTQSQIAYALGPAADAQKLAVKNWEIGQRNQLKS